MSERRSEKLIEELARDLTPVRPIRPLRRVILGVVALWLAVAGVGVALLGLRPDLVQMLQQPLGPGGVFFGLGLAGLGGLVAALALSVPGRESLARAGLLTSLSGMAVAAGIGTLLIVRSPLIETGTSLGTDLNCLMIACAVALLPALGIIAFAGRAAPFRPLVLVVAAAAGTAALGAVTAQASCPSLDPGHLMLGHILAPAVGTLVLALPLLVALRRQAQG